MQIFTAFQLAQQDDLPRMHPEVLYDVVDRFQHIHISALDLLSALQGFCVETSNHFISFFDNRLESRQQFSCGDLLPLIKFLLTFELSSTGTVNLT